MPTPKSSTPTLKSSRQPSDYSSVMGVCKPKLIKQKHHGVAVAVQSGGPRWLY